MKKKFALPLACGISVVIVAIVAIVVAIPSDEDESNLSKQEKLAMDKLPGYFFVFEGTTNHIVSARSHKAFLAQHPMMPYLEPVIERLEKRPWAKDFAIRIQETETQVIISLPSWAEQRGMAGPTVFHSGYSLRVVIDKKTKTIISALQG